MPTTPNGIRYPQGSDSADIPLHFQNLASDVDTKFVPITFASNSPGLHLHRTGLAADQGNWRWYIGGSGEVQFATETDAEALTNRASIQRDGQVRANAAAPAAAADLTRKDYVDGQISALTTTSTLTPAANWADYGGVFGGLHVTRVSSIVTINGLIKRTNSDYSPTTNVAFQVATVPANFRPSAQYIGVIMASPTGVSGGSTYAYRLDILTDGTVNVTAPSATPFAYLQNGWIPIHASYRAA